MRGIQCIVDPVPAYTLLELNKFSLVFRVNKMSRFSSNKATLYKSFYVKNCYGKMRLNLLIKKSTNVKTLVFCLINHVARHVAQVPCNREVRFQHKTYVKHAFVSYAVIPMR